MKNNMYFGVQKNGVGTYPLSSISKWVYINFLKESFLYFGNIRKFTAIRIAS